MKFEDAFWITHDRTISFKELRNTYEQNPALFSTEYRGYLYCLECHMARLEYVNKQSPYLGTWKGDQHDASCSDRAPPASAKQFTEYYNSKDNKADIARRLKSTIAMLFHDKKFAMEDDPFILHLPSSKKSAAGSSLVKRAYGIRRKKITMPLDSEDYDCLKIFYGTVSLSWNPPTSNGHHDLVVKSFKDTTTLCSVWMSDAVYNHLPSWYHEIDETSIFNVAFFSQLNKVIKKGVLHNNAHIYYSTEIEIEHSERPVDD